ncbi:MAG: protein tyrosine phosphatase [Oscillospiraceae bacterium]
MKLLFLCSQNKRRSLTAEKIFNNTDGHTAKSAGTENNARIKVSSGMIGWADIIFTMEKKHTNRIQGKYKEELKNKSVVCLYIPDNYAYMDPKLIEVLREKVENYMQSLVTVSADQCEL